MTGNTMPYLGELYVELTTRKLAIDFNKETDCIYEVYNSWFKFFSWCREQMKEMASKYSDIIPIINKASKVDYSLTITEEKYVKMYNLYLECMEVMRPHIEKYSYDFRDFWEGEKHQRYYRSQSISNQYAGQGMKQDFQQYYPCYQEILYDIESINKKYQHIVEEIVDHIIKYCN
jgi:hypothetical protein